MSQVHIVEVGPRDKISHTNSRRMFGKEES